MVEVTPAKLKEHLICDFQRSSYPVYIWGAPGTGKSSIVAQVCEQMNLKLVLLSVALEHPYTLGGLPAVLWRERSVTKLPPSYIKNLKDAVLFLDDFAASDPAQQRVALTLTTYRRVGDYDLDKSVRIVFASNRVEDNSFIIRPSMAVLNRVKHYLLVPSLDDWLDFLLERSAPLDEISEFGTKVWCGLIPYIVAFMKTQPNRLFSDVSKVGNTVAYPTPRSWFNALSDLSLYFKEGKLELPLNKEASVVANTVVGSWVGGDAARYFVAMLGTPLDAVETYKKNPNKLKGEPIHNQIIYALFMISGGVPVDDIAPYIQPESASLLAFLTKKSQFLSQEDKIKLGLSALRRRKR